MSLTTLGVGGGARWFVGAAEAIDFANGWSLSGGAPSSLLTTTRASTAWAPNAAGVYTSFSSNTPRITDLGLLTEEARTNSIRNNSMQGVTTGVIGSGGALPTNWSNAALLGLTLAVTGSGTELGMDYIELRLSGTSSGSGSAQVYFDTTTGITAASGQTWTESAFVRLAAGSWANVSNGGPRLEIWELTSGGAYVTEGDSSYFTGIGTTYQRLSYTYALVGGGTVARALPLINLIYGNGVAIDVTFRIAWPQFEQGAFVTSPVRTTAAATTRAADAVSLTTVPVSGGTWTAFIDATSPDNSATRYFLAEASGNRVIYNSGSNVAASAFNGSAAVANGFGPTGGWATGGRAAVGASGAGRSVVFNNSAVGTDANTQTFPTTLYIGGISSGALGAVTTRRIALWSVRLPDPQLQALTA